ncbi:MAG: hypothetical protein ACR2IF_14245 [Terriglobales bacterium]
MPRMIELMKQSAVPANVMRSAAKGALALPAPEMIEVLIYLAGTPLFGEQARMTLAGWDEAACQAVCSDPATPPEVLDYFLRNRRPRLMLVLLDNSSVPESALIEMAHEQSAESVQLLLAVARAKSSRNVLTALAANPVLTPSQIQQVKAAREALGDAAAEPAAETASEEHDAQVAQFIAEHAEEIAAEEGKAFQLVGSDEPEHAPAEAAAAAAVPAVAAAAAAPELAAKAAAKPLEKQDTSRMSPLQRISLMTVGQRVQLAMKGNKEERYVLIRDGSKVVSSAVLESPKLTDQEIEMFASLKNVQESVLRGIAGKRKFMKSYGVVRSLANNPRCPLDVQLTIAKNLLNPDLRALSMNKNVSETVRKVALKLFKERTEKKSGLSD